MKLAKSNEIPKLEEGSCCYELSKDYLYFSKCCTKSSVLARDKALARLLKEAIGDMRGGDKRSLEKIEKAKRVLCVLEGKE